MSRSILLLRDRMQKSGDLPKTTRDSNENYSHPFSKEEILFLEYARASLYIKCWSGELCWNDRLQIIHFFRGKMITFLKRVRKDEERRKHYCVHNLRAQMEAHMQDLLDFMHGQFKMDSIWPPHPKKARSLRVQVLDEIEDYDGGSGKRVLISLLGQKMWVHQNDSGQVTSTSPEKLLQLVETRNKKNSSRNLESSSPANIGGSNNIEPQLLNPGEATMADAKPPLADEPREAVPMAIDWPREADTGQGILIMRRVLHGSDCRNSQQRISMPCNQATSVENFLTREEFRMLQTAPFLAIKVIDPARRVYDSHLRKTKAGPKTFSYAIGKPWNTIRDENGFHVGTALNIWALRGDDRQLQILLERNCG